MQELLSVNVGMPRPIDTPNGPVLTGIFKTPTETRVRVRKHNLDGDGQADLKSHGGENKAVYGYPFEHYPTWAAELGRDDLSPGQFGENLTTRGLLETEVGLGDVFEIGTARGSKIEDIEICGKTGTAENFARINGEKVQFTDHSIFIAFAPKDDPKIAIAVFVENGYWGSRWAAPIASLMIEKYIKGSISRDWLEKRMLDGSLEEEYEKQLEIETYVAQKEE